MKQITLDEAIQRLKANKQVLYQDKDTDNFQNAAPLKTSILELGNVKFYAVDGSIEKSRTFVTKDLTLEEALRLIQSGAFVYFHKDTDPGTWFPLSKTTSFSLQDLLNTKFKAEVQARSISLVMTPRIPPASKRNAFEFHNEELDISIYGKKGTIPHSSSKGIRVQITEIL
jgi:hypothetical protein